MNGFANAVRLTAKLHSLPCLDSFQVDLPKEEQVLEELELLMNVLEGCEKRPAMYGAPEHCETLCKHVAHICLVILEPEWSFDMTKELWFKISNSLGYGGEFAFPKFEMLRYRYAKWGNQEAEYREQITETFKRIWNDLKNSCVTLPSTSEWLEHLLETPEVLGSPDNLDTTLSYLMRIASNDCAEHFDELYKKECVKMKGNAIRGLLDFGVREGWTWDPPKFADLRPSYERVSKGVHEIVNYIEYRAGSQ